MRIYLTGASGFVGSNLAHVFAQRHGAEVIAPGHEHVDLTDAVVVGASVAATRPDAIVHAAIWNDPGMLRRDWRRAWDVKASSELVITERAQRGTVARLAGVQGIHRARSQAPRAQDAGFGYLVASLVEALRAGLARRAVAVFELDPGLLDVGPGAHSQAAELEESGRSKPVFAYEEVRT